MFNICQLQCDCVSKSPTQLVRKPDLFYLGAAHCIGSAGCRGGVTMWGTAEGPCTTPAHPTMSKSLEMLLIKSTWGLGWEAIAGHLGTTLLKGNSQVETCSFAVLSASLLSGFVVVGKSSPKQGLSSVPDRVQVIAGRHLGFPPGSNNKITSSFKCEGPDQRFLDLKELKEKELMEEKMSVVQCLGEVVFNCRLGISHNF